MCIHNWRRYAEEERKEELKIITSLKLIEMATEDFKREMEYNQCLAGDNDSGSTSYSDQSQEGCAVQRLRAQAQNK